MKRLYTSLVGIYVLFISFACNAQNIEYGVFVGENINFVSVRSDNVINGEKMYKPGFSFNIGGFLKKEIKPINLISSIEYIRTRNRTEVVLTDAIGNTIGFYSPNIINHRILVNIISTINIAGGFYVGAGIGGSFILNSKIKFKDDLIVAGVQSGNSFTNVSYNRFMFSVPFIIGYDFKRIGIFTRFNLGVMNRIKGDSYIREYESSITTGISYRLNVKN